MNKVYRKFEMKFYHHNYFLNLHTIFAFCDYVDTSLTGFDRIAINVTVQIVSIAAYFTFLFEHFISKSIPLS